ncbi:MAG: hypothetical protein O2917_08580 [Acidobacteria bacterium]|nr:hypothetical protein [Acidobacteriota bacterium]
MAASRPTPPPPDRSHVALPVSWLMGLGILFALPWIVVAAMYFGDTQDGQTADALPVGVERQASAGPWGHLQLTPIVISPPLEYVPADWGRNAPAEWVFPEATPELVTAFLASVGLSPEQITQLSPHIRRESRINGVVIAPPSELVRALSPDVRARLYTQLSKSTLNFDQAQSFRFLGQSARDWFGGSLMSPATRQLVEPLLYQDGDFLHFADIESIRSQIVSPLERQYLAKSLLRNSTFLVRLSVDALEDVDALAAYWGVGGRRTDIRPLLESISDGNDNRLVDIVHLLPVFARNHLYRYPKIQTIDLTRPVLANCLWSSLNFFGDKPDDRYLDVNYALNALRTEYYVVEHGYQLGDVVALVDDEGDLFHVAVYLADGLLFTKNGTSPVAPWTIMSVDHLKNFYNRRSENPRVIYHRLNAY